MPWCCCHCAFPDVQPDVSDHRRRPGRLHGRGVARAPRLQGAGAGTPEVPALLDRRKPARLQHGAARRGRHGRSRDGARLPVQERRRVRPRGRTSPNSTSPTNPAPGYPFTFQVPRADFDETLAARGAAPGRRAALRSGDHRRGLRRRAAHGHQPHGRRRRPKSTSRASCSTPRASAARCPNYSTCIARRRFRRGPPSSRTCATTRWPARSTGRRSASGIHPTDYEVWSWLIPFSNGNASVGVVASIEHHKARTGTPEEQFWQAIGRRAAPARPARQGAYRAAAGRDHRLRRHGHAAARAGISPCWATPRSSSIRCSLRASPSP